MHNNQARDDVAFEAILLRDLHCKSGTVAPLRSKKRPSPSVEGPVPTGAPGALAFAATG